MYANASTSFLWAEHYNVYTHNGYPRTDFQKINVPKIAMDLYAYIGTGFVLSEHQYVYKRNLRTS